MKSAGNSGFKAWLKLAAMVMVPPAILLMMGMFYISHLNRELVLKNFESEATEKLEQLRVVANNEKYICQQFLELFDKSASEKALQNAVEIFASEHDLKFDFLIWQKDGSTFYSSFQQEKWAGDWKKAYFDLLDFNNRKYSSEAYIPLETYGNLRDIFGPHFFPRYFHRCYSGSNIRLLYNDNSRNKPLLWLKVTDRFGLAAFFDYSVSVSYAGVYRMLKKEPEGDFELAVINREEVISRHDDLIPLIKGSVELIRASFKSIIKIDNFYLTTNYIDNNLTGVCLINASRVDGINLSDWMKFLCAAGLFFTLILLYKSYQIIVCKQKFSMKIKMQLLMLFVFSNAMPGFVLSVISWDYLGQYRQSLLNQAYSNGMSALQSVDDLYENELTFQKDRLGKAFKSFERNLKKNGITRKNVRRFVKSQKPKAYRMFLVGSDTPYIASNEAIMKNGVISEVLEKNYTSNPNKFKQLKAFYKIGKYFLATLNKKTISNKIGTEVEILTDALSQQSPVQLMQEFLDRDGRFWSWGVGHKRFPAYIKLFQLYNEDSYDYMLLYLWNTDELQLNFMLRSYPKFSKNEQGFKIMVVNDTYTRAMPKELMGSEKLRDFSTRLLDKTVRKLDYCDWENQKYLLIGLKCVNMNHFRLLGLYPLELIENKVKRITDLLLGLALASILITISLGMFVARSVLEPLDELSKGIEALGSRQFSYRLPDLGGDEFGHLAKIFNTTLIDLEEMHNASMVKEKLMTPTETPLQVGSYQMFGKTISLSEMGGDFLEVQPLSDNSARVVLGDVVGGGISSTLILAYIKSALMQLDSYSSQGEKIVDELDRLFRVSGRKDQRKFMALQYLYVDDKNNLIELVNAGMFYPVKVSDSGRNVQQIEMPGPTLGASAKVIRPAVKVELAPGDLLMLFTNGVLSGGRIEHSEILELVKDSDFFSIEALHESFCSKFQKKFVDRGLSDDVTVVILQNVSDKEGNQNGKEPC